MPGMTEARVTALLGKPTQIEESVGFIARVLVYPGFRVELDEEHLVAGARSFLPTICLGNGLCPGASAESAYRKLPELRHGIQAMSTGDGCWLEVPVVHRRVKAVALICQP
jgi:hypothetical protein